MDYRTGSSRIGDYTRIKKTRFPDSNTRREPCRPALLDIGESLSAYLQAVINIQPQSADVNTFLINMRRIPYVKKEWFDNV